MDRIRRKTRALRWVLGIAAFAVGSAHADLQVCNLPDVLALRRKQVEVLEQEAERARQGVTHIEGEASTTAQRSEFKNPVTAGEKSAGIEAANHELEKLPPGPNGKKVELRYRDKPREDGRRTYTDTGSSLTFKTRSNLGDAGIREATHNGQALRTDVDGDLYRRVQATPDEVIAAIRTRKPEIKDADLPAAIEAMESNLRQDLVARMQGRTVRIEQASGQTVPHAVTPPEAGAMADDLLAARYDTGKIRYRKYWVKEDNASFDGTASPGSLHASTDRPEEALFKGKTMIEFKGKDAQGLAARRTVVNKPRLLVSDELLPELQDAKCLLDPKCFAALKAKLLKDVRRNFTAEDIGKYRKDFQTPEGQQAIAQRLVKGRYRGLSPKDLDAWKAVAAEIKPMLDAPDGLQRLIAELAENPQGFLPKDFKPSQAEAMIDFFRGVRRQGLSTLPVQRTIYTRDAYAVDLPTGDGRAVEAQVTFDRNIIEADLATGQTVGAYPFVEKSNGWTFQYNPQLKRYEHTVNGKAQHVYNPQTKEVLPVVGTKVVPQALTGTTVEPVIVAEVKVPVRFIEMTDADVAAVPSLGPVRDLRNRFNAGTNALNDVRQREGLIPYKIDSGKSGSNFRGTAWPPLNVRSQNAGMLEGFIYDLRHKVYIRWGRDGRLEYMYDTNSHALFEASDTGRLVEVQGRNTPIAVPAPAP